MSLDVNGFTEEIEGGVVTMTVSHEHRLLKLARSLPWDTMLEGLRLRNLRPDAKLQINIVTNISLLIHIEGGNQLILDFL